MGPPLPDGTAEERPELPGFCEAPGSQPLPWTVFPWCPGTGAGPKGGPSARLPPVSSRRVQVPVHLGTPLLHHFWGPEWLWAAGACPAGGPEGVVIQILQVQRLCFKEAGQQLRLKGGRPPNPWADVAVSRLRRSHPWPRPGSQGLRLGLFCPFFQLELPSLPCGHGPHPCAPLSVLSTALWFPLGRGCSVTLGRALRMPFLAKSSQGNPPPLSGPLERLMASEGAPGLLKLSSPGCCGAQPSLQASLLGAGGGEDREGVGGGFCWELQGPRFGLEAGDSFPPAARGEGWAGSCQH